MLHNYIITGQSLVNVFSLPMNKYNRIHIAKENYHLKTFHINLLKHFTIGKHIHIQSIIFAFSKTKPNILRIFCNYSTIFKNILVFNHSIIHNFQIPCKTSQSLETLINNLIKAII